jgi:hypothetical protein
MSDVDYSTPAQLPDDPTEAERRLQWHARRARTLEAERLEIEDRYKAEIDRLTEEMQYEVAALRRQIDWHETPIRAYHTMRLAEDPTYPKTLKLPDGRSKYITYETPRVFVDPEDSSGLVEWACTHPEIMRPPNITEVRRIVTVTDEGKVVDKATGEVVPGVVALVPEQSWSFTPAPGRALHR